VLEQRVERDEQVEVGSRYHEIDIGFFMNWFGNEPSMQRSRSTSAISNTLPVLIFSMYGEGFEYHLLALALALPSPSAAAARYRSTAPSPHASRSPRRWPS
jgi:hypothetical protein